MGCGGRPWQVHSTYLNKGREERKGIYREKERKREKGKYRKGNKKEIK